MSNSELLKDIIYDVEHFIKITEENLVYMNMWIDKHRDNKYYEPKETLEDSSDEELFWNKILGVHKKYNVKVQPDSFEELSLYIEECKNAGKCLDSSLKNTQNKYDK